MDPAISILIPTYNASNVISDCIESALSLQYEDIEIIVGNDGSTDNTDEVLDEYSDKRLRKYTNKENIGFDKNIHKIAEEANGDYIYFISDEDVIHPTGFERIYELATNPIHTSVIFGNILDAREGDANYYYKKNEEFWMFPDNAIRAFASDFGTGGWWGHSYMTGTVIKSDYIDFNFLEDYIGCSYMVSAMVAKALLQGGLYWIDDPVAIITPSRADRVPATKSNEDMISFKSIEARYKQVEYRLQFAEESDLGENLYEFIKDEEKEYIVNELYQKYGLNLIRHLNELDKTILKKEDLIKILGRIWVKKQIADVWKIVQSIN